MFFKEEVTSSNLVKDAMCYNMHMRKCTCLTRRNAQDEPCPAHYDGMNVIHWKAACKIHTLHNGLWWGYPFKDASEKLTVKIEEYRQEFRRLEQRHTLALNALEEVRDY